MPAPSTIKTAPIPFGNLLASGQEVLGGAMPSALNVAVDATGTVRRRPGLQTHAKAPTTAISSAQVDGLHVTPFGALYASAEGSVTGNRDLYLVSGGAGALLGSMSGGRRAVFADTEALVVIANGADMYKVELATNTMSLLGGSPPQASHVIFNASRLIANDLVIDRSKANYSSPAISTVTTGHEQWGGTGTSGFFSAEARPDPVVALGENANEVFVWGSQNLEIYGPDSLLVFARLAARDYGCVAPYSVVRYDDAWVWLDHRRRVVRSDGRSVQDLSGPIANVLDGLSRVDDCFAYRADVAPADCVVFTFPSAGLTLALQSGGGWAQWASFAAGEFGAFPVTAHAHDSTTDANFVGLSDGRVAQLVDGVADDLGDPIVAHVESGFRDHGTSKQKVNTRVRLMLRRGTTTFSQDPVAWLQWADSPGAWSSKREIYLGDSGDTNPVVTFNSTGVYRQRNWRFVFSAAADLALVRAEEEFEIAEE